MKTYIKIITIIFINFIVFSCEDEEENSEYNMCYSIEGNYLEINCSQLGECSDGKVYLATYLNDSDCFSDLNDVVEHWENTGELIVGPNAIDSGDDSGGGNCSLDDYNGPESASTAQQDAFCKAAYIYDCTGNIQARDETCNSLATWDPSYDCPYCD